MINIPRRKQKIKYSRKFACKFLEPAGDISNSLQSLCVCKERDLVLGRKAYVCQVCDLYSQATKKFSDVYEESKKIAEQKVKEKQIELDEFELTEISSENELDLSIDEWNKFYEELFGGFENLADTIEQDEEEEDELEYIPENMKTKSGYLKDGFVVDDNLIEDTDNDNDDSSELEYEKYSYSDDE